MDTLNKDYHLKTYQHYKNRKYYNIISIARDCSNSDRILVIYRGLYTDPVFGSNPVWVRSFDEFFGNVKIDGMTIPRFCPLDGIYRATPRLNTTQSYPHLGKSHHSHHSAQKLNTSY